MSMSTLERYRPQYWIPVSDLCNPNNDKVSGKRLGGRYDVIKNYIHGFN